MSKVLHAIDTEWKSECCDSIHSQVDRRHAAVCFLFLLLQEVTDCLSLSILYLSQSQRSHWDRYKGDIHLYIHKEHISRSCAPPHTDVRPNLYTYQSSSLWIRLIIHILIKCESFSAKPVNNDNTETIYFVWKQKGDCIFVYRETEDAIVPYLGREGIVQCGGDCVSCSALQVAGSERSFSIISLSSESPVQWCLYSIYQATGLLSTRGHGIVIARINYGAQTHRHIQVEVSESTGSKLGIELRGVLRLLHWP